MKLFPFVHRQISYWLQKVAHHAKVIRSCSYLYLEWMRMYSGTEPIMNER